MPMSLPLEDAVCVQGNAKLSACKPGDGDDACGRPEFGCLRTDVTTDEGICVTMKPCQLDSDCRRSGSLDVRVDLLQEALQQEHEGEHRSPLLLAGGL